MGDAARVFFPGDRLRGMKPSAVIPSIGEEVAAPHIGTRFQRLCASCQVTVAPPGELQHRFEKFSAHHMAIGNAERDPALKEICCGFARPNDAEPCVAEVMT